MKETRKSKNFTYESDPMNSVKIVVTKEAKKTVIYIKGRRPLISQTIKTESNMLPASSR